MQDIASGSITGSPDAHIIHMNYLIGLLISSFYKLWPNSPWYGIYLVGIVFLCNVLIIYRISSSFKILTGKIITLVLYSVMFVVLEMSQIVTIQYSAVAGLAGGTAIFLFCTNKCSEKINTGTYLFNNIPVFLLCLLSFCTRNKSFLILLPIAGVIWLYKFFSEKENRKNHVLFFAVLFMQLLVLYLADYSGYSSSDWREFKNYNHYRENLIDYYGYPNYEENTNLYENLQITKEMYVAMEKNYFFLFYDLDSAKMKTLAAASADIYKQTHPLRGQISYTLKILVTQRLFNFNDSRNILIVLMYGATFLPIVIRRKWRVLPSLGMVFIACSFCWFYILYYGRSPERVTQPLYMAEFLALLGITILNNLWQPEKKSDRPIFSINLIIMSVVALTVLFRIAPTCIQNYYNLQKFALSEGMNSKNFDQMNNYCTLHPQNIYYTDLYSIAGFTGYVLNCQKPVYYNYIVAGGWLVHSPLIQNKLNSFHISSPEKAFMTADNVFFIFNLGQDFTQDYLWNYLDQNYTYNYYQEDTIITSSEVSFGVYGIK